MTKRDDEGNDRSYENVAVTDYWFTHYVERGMCSLCGQSGYIDTAGTISPAGLVVGRLNYCICPNGQKLRALYNRENTVA